MLSTIEEVEDKARLGAYQDMTLGIQYTASSAGRVASSYLSFPSS